MRLDDNDRMALSSNRLDNPRRNATNNRIIGNVF